jgi:glutamine synthetase adenylyltransferase
VVEDQTARDLTEAYRQLRNVEHRIQMRNDEQTHTLPKDPEAREVVAFLSGYGNLEEFDRDVLETRRIVQSAYDALFAAEDRAAGETRSGNFVFTGSMTIRERSKPSAISASVIPARRSRQSAAGTGAVCPPRVRRAGENY